MVTIRFFIAILISYCLILSHPAVSSMIQHSIHESSTSMSFPAGDEHNEVMEDLIDWIIANSDYVDYGKPRPKLVRANRAFMEDLWSSLNNGKKPDGSIGAMHVWSPRNDDNNKSTIYIPIYFNIHDALDRKTLVHELVHHLQYWNGTRFTLPCYKKLEYDAYMIAVKYLKAGGYKNAKVIRSNEEYARTKSECTA